MINIYEEAVTGNLHFLLEGGATQRPLSYFLASINIESMEKARKLLFKLRWIEKQCRRPNSPLLFYSGDGFTRHTDARFSQGN